MEGTLGASLMALTTKDSGFGALPKARPLLARAVHQ
jgi:hypothetical protein